MRCRATEAIGCSTFSIQQWKAAVKKNGKKPATKNRRTQVTAKIGDRVDFVNQYGAPRRKRETMYCQMHKTEPKKHRNILTQAALEFVDTFLGGWSAFSVSECRSFGIAPGAKTWRTPHENRKKFLHFPRKLSILSGLTKVKLAVRVADALECSPFSPIIEGEITIFARKCR